MAPPGNASKTLVSQFCYGNNVQQLGRNEETDEFCELILFPQFGFLEQFGYLTGGGVASEALHTEEAMVEAIRFVSYSVVVVVEAIR